jgi:hypothetical protein
MSRLMRCRRCGVLFVPDRFTCVPRARRLCPRCREPVPPTGGVPLADGGWLRPRPSEAAA